MKAIWQRDVFSRDVALAMAAMAIIGMA